MNCEQAEELLGAYALDALPDAEAAAMRAHLVTCTEHAAAAAELRAAGRQLSALAEPMQPPAGLRSRILAATAREPQFDAAPRAEPVSIAHTRKSENRRQWRPTALRPAAFRSYAWGALAAVFVAAVGGLLTWNVVLMNRLDGRDDPSRFAARATNVVPLQAAGVSGSGALVYFAGDKKAAVIADGVALLDASKTYQMWVIRDGAPTSLGLMAPDATGHLAGVVAVDAASGDQIAVTVEPAGGSPQPTSPPVYIADL